MNPKNYVYENKKYEGWVRQRPCVICGSSDVHGHHVEHARRNSFMLVPLCHYHHTFGRDAYHVIEREAFENAHSINLDWCIMGQLMEYINQKEGK